MYNLKVAHMRFADAKSWFISRHQALLATDDNQAKRQAWAACIAKLIAEDAVNPSQGRRWMYPSELDTYRPTPHAK